MKIDNLNIKGNFNMNFLNATLCWREKNMLRNNNNLSKNHFSERGQGSPPGIIQKTKIKFAFILFR